MESLKGSCACGEVNYTITNKPLFTQACHCKDCKKSTGSSFVIHTMIFEEDLKIYGKVIGIVNVFIMLVLMRFMDR